MEVRKDELAAPPEQKQIRERDQNWRKQGGDAVDAAEDEPGVAEPDYLPAHDAESGEGHHACSYGYRGSNSASKEANAAGTDAGDDREKEASCCGNAQEKGKEGIARNTDEEG